MGDQEAAPLSTALYQGIANRDRHMSMVSFFSPPLLIDRWLTHTAKTDVTRHMEYVDCVREFHGELRHFHYQMLFGEMQYSEQIMSQLPQFSPCKTQ